MWEEGGDRHQDGNPEQASSTEAEERSQEPVEETKADGMSGAVEGFAEEGAEHHHGDDDEKKGDDFGCCVLGDEASEDCSDVLVVPGGEQDSGDEAAEREELQDDAAQEGHDGGVGEHRDERAVEEVHAGADISEAGTSGK